ncbi:hypothetical protein D3C78_1644280 [compost metagenome]
MYTKATFGFSTEGSSVDTAASPVELLAVGSVDSALPPVVPAELLLPPQPASITAKTINRIKPHLTV